MTHTDFISLSTAALVLITLIALVTQKLRGRAKSPASPASPGPERLEPAAVATTVLGPPHPAFSFPAHGPPDSGWIDAYRLLDRLGSGHFGEVWRAQAPGGVTVAIKRVFCPIDSAEAQRELAAMEVVKHLRHPFVLSTHGFGISKGQLFIVTELADADLHCLWKERRRQGKPMPTRELITYLKEAAEGLDYLHQNRITHRDIKPQNILLINNHAKVADFGLARWLQASMAMVTCCGTPLYMAPEVWKERGSMHSDQYSLAALFVHLYLNRPLFLDTSFQAQMRGHLEHVPDLAPLTDAQQRVLRRALAKDAHGRFPSCSAFIAALAEVLPE